MFILNSEKLNFFLWRFLAKFFCANWTLGVVQIVSLIHTSGPSTFILLDRLISYFWAIHNSIFNFRGLFTSTFIDRPQLFFDLFRTVHF